MTRRIVSIREGLATLLYAADAFFQEHPTDHGPLSLSHDLEP